MPEKLDVVISNEMSAVEIANMLASLYKDDEFIKGKLWAIGDALREKAWQILAAESKEKS